MALHITESVWLNTSGSCTLQHLLDVSGLTEDNIHDLIDTGIIEPSNRDPSNYYFPANTIVIARTARRLRDDFELDSDGLLLALNLLRRVDHLETEIAALRARLIGAPSTR